MSLNADPPLFLRNPVFYFPIFLSANFLLSYYVMPLEGCLTVLFLGILLPLTLAFFSAKKQPTQDNIFRSKDDVHSPPSWAWVAVFLLAGWERFYHLTSLVKWPTRDEGYFFLPAMELNHHLSLPFFYGIGEIPPLFDRLLAFFLGWFVPSLFSLKLFPAIISLLTVAVGYKAVRPFFSGTYSLIFVFLLATGFWPLCLGRFCIVWVLLFLWECLLGGILLTLFLSNRPKTFSVPLFLGFCLGMGFYISPNHWVSLSLVVVLSVLGWASQRTPVRWRRFWIFFLSFLAAALPFAVLAVSRHYGRHIYEVWPGMDSIFSLNQAYRCWLYLSGVFWGLGFKGYNYGPVWGGLLNPVLGSFFFTGLVYFFSFKHRGTVGLTALALLILLIPGFATHDVEMQRIFTLIPLLIFTATAGAVYFASNLPKGFAAPVLIGLLGLSASLDFYGLTVPFAAALNPPWSSAQSLESEESYTAYGILKKKAQREGPGWIFLDFVSQPLDQTLGIVTSPFNLLAHPGLGVSRPAWAAFLTNINYQPFLASRFPDAEWHVVGSKRMPWDGELILGILPLSSQERGAINQWRLAEPVFRGLTLGILRQSEGKPRGKILDSAFKDYALLKGDPFLESAFWEIAYFNHSSDKNFLAALSDLQMIFKKGYPAAHIYNELGGLLYFKGDFKEAKLAFRKALLLGKDQTLAGENLQFLETQGH